MKTYIVQIGNSDDKLKQNKWGTFCANLEKLITSYAKETHFWGFSPGNSKWQNACIVFTLSNNKDLGLLKQDLATLAKEFKQDSIALTIGDTIFV